MSEAKLISALCTCIWIVMTQKSCAAGLFIEEPQTVNITAGNDAIFRCMHSDADFVGWRINGESARRSNISGVNIQVNQLTILALPEYNGTVVECIALYADGTRPQTSHPALLIVQGSCNNGTAAIAFTQEPISQNVAQGDTVEFRCHHPTADYIGWTLNGTSANNSTQNGSILLHRAGSQLILIVGAIPTYGGTIVICVAGFSSICPSQESGPAVLLIQGPLQAVSALVRGAFGEGDVAGKTYSWVPPPSLDLTDVEPDIAYCITIHNITCGRNDFLISDCSLLETYYFYENIQLQLVYRVEVTPRSNVELATNGTPLSVDERFLDLKVSYYHVFKDFKSENLTIYLELVPNTVILSGILIVPEQYVVAIRTIDKADKLPVKISRVVQGHVRNFTFSLQNSRLWEYNFLAYGCEQHLLGSIIISTHDIQNITSTVIPGIIRVTGQVVDRSTTNRALIIVYSLTNESDVHYTFGEGRSFQTDVSHLQLGIYGVAVFVVEENGTVFPRVAALPQFVNYSFSEASNDDKSKEHVMIDYTLGVNSTGVNITCTFLESSTATDCVTVVHQRISQLNSSAGLMNIESSHKFTRSGDTASGYIEGVNIRISQVGVIGGQLVTEIENEIGNESTNIKIIIATPVAAIVLILICIITCIIICVIRVICVRTRVYFPERREKKSPTRMHSRSDDERQNVDLKYVGQNEYKRRQNLRPNFEQQQNVRSEFDGQQNEYVAQESSPSTKGALLTSSSILRDPVLNPVTEGILRENVELSYRTSSLSSRKETECYRQPTAGDQDYQAKVLVGGQHQSTKCVRNELYEMVVQVVPESAYEILTSHSTVTPFSITRSERQGRATALARSANNPTKNEKYTLDDSMYTTI